MVERYPVSSMQKTGWTNPPFLVWSVKGFHLWMLSFGGIQQPFFCVLGHFWHDDTQPKNNQLGDPSAGLLLTSEKAVFCKIHVFIISVMT